MDGVTFESGDFFHTIFLHDLAAIESSLLDSTVNMAKFSQKVHEIAQHTKNPTRLLKLWDEIEVILNAKSKSRTNGMARGLDLAKPTSQAPDPDVLIKLRELKHETHRIFASDNAKHNLKNKLLILAPLFGADVYFSDWVTYALPFLRPVFFGFGMHLSYKANKESHERDVHDDLAYSEIVAKHDRSHKLSMVEISSVLTIYTAGLSRAQQEVILGAFSAAMIVSDLLVLGVPRLELLGDRLAKDGQNAQTRAVGRGMQRSGEVLIEKVFPRAAFVAEYILAGRALTHSSVFVEKTLVDGLDLVRAHFGELGGYIVNISATGATGFIGSFAATFVHTNLLVPLRARIVKTDFWRAAQALSTTVLEKTSHAKDKLRNGRQRFIRNALNVPRVASQNVVATTKTMRAGSHRIMSHSRNLSQAALVNAMMANNPKQHADGRADFLLVGRPAYYGNRAAVVALHQHYEI